MASKKVKLGLNEFEKRIVKRLLEDGWRNQDIQARINYGRPATINGARITGVKQSAKQESASDEELARFEAQKRSYDSRTGLNPFSDERLVKAREAMILAVRSFNDPSAIFKTEVFCVLNSIAWTYLLHEYLERRGQGVLRRDGKTLALSEMIARPDVPLSTGMRNNLGDLIKLRDEVEHTLLRAPEDIWHRLFQAACLNFDNVLCAEFGPQLSLAGQLSLSLQFAKLTMGHASQLSGYELPEKLTALNKAIEESHTAEELADTEYQFTVHYTMTAASKSSAAINFVAPDSETGREVANVLLKYKSSDELYPLRATVVAKKVAAATGKKFSMSDHTAAWRKAGIRPPNNSPDKKKTNSKYCTYHATHGDYTYSEAWLEKLIADLGGRKTKQKN